MMGRQTGDQSQLFYLFNLERRIPASHLLRRINPVVTQILADLRDNLAPFYSDIGRPSIDPELMLRMLIVGYCYGIPYGQEIKTVGKASVVISQRGLVACRRLRFFERSVERFADRRANGGNAWSGHASWPTSPGRWTRSCCCGTSIWLL